MPRSESGYCPTFVTVGQYPDSEPRIIVGLFNQRPSGGIWLRRNRLKAELKTLSANIKILFAIRPLPQLSRQAAKI
jgi:hypothetical protein